MNNLPRFAWVDLLLGVVVLTAAVGTRAGYVYFATDSGRCPGPFAVQDDRTDEIRSLAEGVQERRIFASRAPLAGAIEPTAHTAPGFPYLLGLAKMLPLEADLLVRWVQVGLGAVTAALYFLFARRAFRSRIVAVIAGLLCALHPFWILNTAELDDGVVTTFLLAAVLYLGATAADGGRVGASLLFGLGLAALALTRATLLPCAFVVLLWFLDHCRHLPRGWLYAVLAFLGFVNGLAPWLVRNVQARHGVTPIVDSTYYHLYVGNNPHADGGPLDDVTVRRSLEEALAEEPEDLARRFAELAQRERYDSLAGAVGTILRSDPAGALRRRLGAGLYFVFGRDFFHHGRLWRVVATDAESSPPVPAWLLGAVPMGLFGSLLGMVLLGGLGWRWTYAWRHEAKPAALVFVWLPLPYLLSHAEALSGPRLPLDGICLCYAAFALVCLVPGLGGSLLSGPTTRPESHEGSERI